MKLVSVNKSMIFKVIKDLSSNVKTTKFGDRAEVIISGWRYRKKVREPIPEKLWEAVEKLLLSYTKTEVVRGLGLNHTALLNRLKKKSSAKPVILRNILNCLRSNRKPINDWGIYPVYNELFRQAAQGDLFHNDDTTNRILALLNQKNDKAARKKICLLVKD